MAWICFNDAMLSVVTADGDPDMLLVRARVPGDIERVIGDVPVDRTPERDYLFRAIVPRERVAAAVGGRISGIDYPNFKGSVRELVRKRAYSDVWACLLRLQGKVGRYAGVADRS